MDGSRGNRRRARSSVSDDCLHRFAPRGAHDPSATSESRQSSRAAAERMIVFAPPDRGARRRACYRNATDALARPRSAQRRPLRPDDWCPLTTSAAAARHRRVAPSPLKQLSPRCLLIARDAKLSKHSQRYVLVEVSSPIPRTRPRRRSHCRDRFDFPGGSWPAIAKATSASRRRPVPGDHSATKGLAAARRGGLLLSRASHSDSAAGREVRRHPPARYPSHAEAQARSAGRPRQKHKWLGARRNPSHHRLRRGPDALLAASFS